MIGRRCPVPTGNEDGVPGRGCSRSTGLPRQQLPRRVLDLSSLSPVARSSVPETDRQMFRKLRFQMIANGMRVLRPPGPRFKRATCRTPVENAHPTNLSVRIWSGPRAALPASSLRVQVRMNVVENAATRSIQGSVSPSVPRKPLRMWDSTGSCLQHSLGKELTIH